MPYQRLPETVHVLYAELLEQAIHAEASAAAVDAPTGSFVSKVVKGRTYWYLQRVEGERKRQQYLGPESPELLAWMEGVRAARSDLHADGARRATLCSMLTAGGAATASPAVARVLEILAETGVFRRGGVLVGTHAMAVYGNMLGVRFEHQALRTHDIDVAQDPVIGVALADDVPVADVAERFQEIDAKVFAVPGLDPRQPSTSFKFRGLELRIDFLTPLHGPESEQPIRLRTLGVAAQPLRFLDYLIAAPVQAVVVARSGILVNVPTPARFALHKLWLSQRRPATEQTKSLKDMRQAEQLLEVLLDDRPGDVTLAWQALAERGSALKRVQAALARLSPEVRERLAAGAVLPSQG